ncbi:MAG: hypothetical protein WKG00_18500 [Polyangiaceae bacterium]
MNGPEMRRLSEEGGSDLEVSLLRSAKGDGPRPAARRRVMVALGVGGSILAASSSSAASVAGIGLVKWLGLAVIASALVAGSVATVQTVSAPEPAGPAQRGASTHAHAVEAVVVERAVASIQGDAALQKLAATTAAEAAPVAPVADASAVPTAETIALGSLPAAPAPAAAKVAAPRPQEAEAPSLADEVAALDRASQAMASDPRGALAQLEKHDKRFARGALGPEAMVLRIEALAKSGDSARASALASEFFAKHADSPLRGRVRSILASMRSEPPVDGAARPAAPTEAAPPSTTP